MPKIVWFTGLSGSGKSTLAAALRDRLEKDGKSIVILDGDVIRATSHKTLGFSRQDIRESNLRIARLAIEHQEKGAVVLVSVISPYAQDRRTVKEMIGPNFVEVYVECPIDVCIVRDTKGLYAKVARGEIDSMIGLSSSHPYEPPVLPDVVINTTNQRLEKSVQILYDAVALNT